MNTNNAIATLQNEIKKLTLENENLCDIIAEMNRLDFQRFLKDNDETKHGDNRLILENKSQLHNLQFLRENAEKSRLEIKRLEENNAKIAKERDDFEIKWSEQQNLNAKVQEVKEEYVERIQNLENELRNEKNIRLALNYRELTFDEVLSSRDRAIERMEKAEKERDDLTKFIDLMLHGGLDNENSSSSGYESEEPVCKRTKKF